MQFTYTVQIDDDYTPWGDNGIAEEETEKINAMEWAPYGVIVRVAGPIEAEESTWGCVVDLTDTGTYHDLAAIANEHLRGIAKELADTLEAAYLDQLIAKRAEIDAMIHQLGSN